MIAELTRLIRCCAAGSVCAALLPFAAHAALPDGPGKDVTVQLCGKCHSPEQAASLRQDRDAWTETIAKMVSMGAQGSDEQFSEILDYLSKNFGPEAPAPINVNKAGAVELESILLLTKTEAAAVLQYRSEKGAFKTIEDLRSVPGLDYKKIEAKKSRITF
ncbi:MAG TPA: helix-hairpin-helix domain-containing protein [Bryobacteraceae bacterium]|jgi:competence protein ComEA|nr:helix-hairpin-helix domain-containing protein [Bryobacteraceae bacterium]